ncbi:ABC transporter permease [Desulfuribacillus alkaliarsenatis]|uniref:ABC transporter permease n=1 Tax=Desulfuribacillus alkaliarsenatis TaxID=766136 RepID=A0A1E5G1E5_9FIRM|nr:ABC transporter permease subunit [Desulfuribacillus alkaliarsenatis]OEF96715.1 hypothetical protein BHF68_06480 [Desulfuribacillus alkaliarsenatis]
MSNLIYNEIYKMIANRKLVIFLFLTIGILLLPAASLIIPELDIPFTGQDYAINMLSGTISMLLPLFIIVMLAEMFASEYEKGTLKNSLIQPVLRTEVLAAKVIAVGIITSVLLLVSMIFSYIIGTLLFGWGEGVLIGGETVSGINGVLITLASHLVSLIPLMAFAFVILAICVAASSGTTAIGVSIGVFFALTFLGQLVEQVRPYLITTHLSFYIQVIEPALRQNLLFTVVVLAAYAVAFLVLAVAMFKRKQIIL